MSLKEAALAAAKTEANGYAEQRETALRASLQNLIEKWDSHWQYRLETAPAVLSEEDFTRASVTVDSHRTSHYNGWRFTIDGVDFLYSDDYSFKGVYVILTCPDCGGERACDLYGMASLGKLLADGRDTSHHCLRTESRNVALAIASAARSAKVGPQRIVDEAWEQHSDILNRLR